MTELVDRLRYRARVLRSVEGNDSAVAMAFHEAATQIDMGGDVDVVDGWLRGRIDALEG